MEYKNMRCKMTLSGLTPNTHPVYDPLTHQVIGEESTYALSFTPVWSGSKENEAFFRWTPGGSINLSVVNENAVVGMKIGQEYYVDFTLADPAH